MIAENDLAYHAFAAATRTKIMPTSSRGLGSLLKICHATKLIADSSAGTADIEPNLTDGKPYYSARAANLPEISWTPRILANGKMPRKVLLVPGVIVQSTT